MKWQLPNPIDKGYKNFNIVPFTAVMHVINKVNIEWRNLGNNPVGDDQKRSFH